MKKFLLNLSFNKNEYLSKTEQLESLFVLLKLHCQPDNIDMSPYYKRARKIIDEHPEIKHFARNVDYFEKNENAILEIKEKFSEIPDLLSREAGCFFDEIKFIHVKLELNEEQKRNNYRSIFAGKNSNLNDLENYSMSIFALYINFPGKHKIIKHLPIDILYLNSNNVWSERIVKIILADNPKVKMKIENDELLLDFYKNRMITYPENWKEYIQDN